MRKIRQNYPLNISSKQLKTAIQMMRLAIIGFIIPMPLPRIVRLGHNQCRALLPPAQPGEVYMWANRRVENGVAGEDVQFLVQVLHPDPNDRLTVREIIDSSYLDE
jgi:hypothetical protein